MISLVCLQNIVLIYNFTWIFFLFQIITNKELISVNQDKLGVQATCKKNCCSHSLFGGGLYAPLTCPGFRSSWQTWSGPLENGDFVVIIVNRYDHDIKVCLILIHSVLNLMSQLYFVRFSSFSMNDQLH